MQRRERWAVIVSICINVSNVKKLCNVAKPSPKSICPSLSSVSVNLFKHASKIEAVILAGERRRDINL